MKLESLKEDVWLCLLGIVLRTSLPPESHEFMQVASGVAFLRVSVSSSPELPFLEALRSDLKCYPCPSVNVSAMPCS